MTLKNFRNWWLEIRRACTSRIGENLSFEECDIEKNPSRCSNWALLCAATRSSPDRCTLTDKRATGTKGLHFYFGPNIPGTHLTHILTLFSPSRTIMTFLRRNKCQCRRVLNLPHLGGVNMHHDFSFPQIATLRWRDNSLNESHDSGKARRNSRARIWTQQVRACAESKGNHDWACLQIRRQSVKIIISFQHAKMWSWKADTRLRGETWLMIALDLGLA